MPIPLPLLLIAAALGLMAVSASSGNEATPVPSAPEEPGPDDPGDPTTPESDEMPPRPRSPRYEAFVNAYAATPFHNVIAQAESAQDIPENLLARTLYQESSFDPEARSATGDLGIAQFQPATAEDLGLDPLNPDEAIPGAARYLKGLFNSTGDWFSALVAYNWGIGRVQQYGAGAAPPKVANYANAILADSEVA